ncbi:hypothetical protein [Ulvibacter antarcticus]|uniref:hypothetical protein n=1 Tax=Ulvibacter antarcticus TaxID=442714 RepID=UPI0011C3B492|nr:hypothetical protein [Ulvibacter antarcticus]
MKEEPGMDVIRNFRKMSIAFSQISNLKSQISILSIKLQIVLGDDPNVYNGLQTLILRNLYRKLQISENHHPIFSDLTSHISSLYIKLQIVLSDDLNVYNGLQAPILRNLYRKLQISENHHPLNEQISNLTSQISSL